ncbi:hypothetical protein KR018_000385, partial [Drosophila ironensis]
FTLNSHSSSEEGIMVGLVCDEGVLLATNSSNHILFQLDERIFCCVPFFGNDRDVVVEVAANVDFLTRDRRQKVTVAQVKDMLCRRFEQAMSVDVLLAGYDSEGLQMYELCARGGHNKVMYAIKGDNVEEEIKAYLSQNYKQSMNFDEAEDLARDSLKMKSSSHPDMCFIYKAVESEVEKVPMLPAVPEMYEDTDSQISEESQE